MLTAQVSGFFRIFVAVAMPRNGSWLHIIIYVYYSQHHNPLRSKSGAMNQESMEEIVRQDLQRYLTAMGEVDERLPECPDVEELWEKIGRSYMADGIREFAAYPTASLGWMMYIGMAVAKLWDTEWDTYSKVDDIYVCLRDKRGYDSMDEYIREEVLGLNGEDYTALEKLVGECASRVYNALMHRRHEPGTPEAFHSYVACIHQLYLMGAAVQLRRMGYHMTPLG